MSNEKWMPVVGYEGLYEVSNFGNIKSLERKQAHYKSGLATKKEKILTVPNPHKTGYIYYKLCNNRTEKIFSAHRIVAMAFIPNPNGYKEVNHKDGNKANNIVENLEWCSREQNQRHAIQNGLVNPICGEKHGMSVLKLCDVIKMRELYSSGKATKAQLSRMFNISKPTAGKIINRTSWINAV